MAHQPQAPELSMSARPAKIHVACRKRRGSFGAKMGAKTWTASNDTKRTSWGQGLRFIWYIILVAQTGIPCACFRSIGKIVNKKSNAIRSRRECIQTSDAHSSVVQTKKYIGRRLYFFFFCINEVLNTLLFSAEDKRQVYMTLTNSALGIAMDCSVSAINLTFKKYSQASTRCAKMPLVQKRDYFDGVVMTGS